MSIPASSPFQIELYTNFIASFETKMNQLKLAKIGIAVARQFNGQLLHRRAQPRPYSRSSIVPDGASALSFLTTLSDKVNTPLTQEAFVLASMEVSHFNLLLGEMELAKSLIDSSEKILEGLDSVEMEVNAGFYRVSGDYYKVGRLHSVIGISTLTMLARPTGQGRIRQLLQELAALSRLRQRCHRSHR